jgi:ferredoxin
MAMRVKIDRQVCQGHGICYFASDRLFRLNEEDGKGEVVLDPVPTELEEKAWCAVEGCPEQAIEMLQED